MTGARVNHLAIIAGGSGSRMRGGAYADVPKALIPVGGKPVLQHQLELAAAAGVSGVTIFAGHLAEQITAFVGDGSRFGLAVRTLVESRPRGTAGALVAALDTLPEQLFVLYGDVMPAVDLARLGAFHLDRRADVTAFAHPNDHPYDSDLLQTREDGRVVAVQLAKGRPKEAYFANLANAALYVARRDALGAFAGPDVLDFASDIMVGMVRSGAKVCAYRSSEYVKDMGTPDRLQRVERDWQAGKIILRAPGRTQRAVFLDRDGTLNVERGYISRPEQIELLPGAAKSLRLLRQAGFLLVVVTNQAVIARGEATEAEVARVHDRLEWDLGKEGAYLDGIYLCPHHPQGGHPGERTDLKIECDCRKPSTGMIERACREFSIDPTRSWVIGDHTRDIEMGRRANLRTALVLTGHGGCDGAFPVTPDLIAADILEAARMIVEDQGVSADE